MFADYLIYASMCKDFDFYILSIMCFFLVFWFLFLKNNMFIHLAFGAPSCSWMVRFLCTVGITFDRADRRAPIDRDFLGWSTLSSPEAAPAARNDLLRVGGQPNCSRYSVLNLDIVFLKSPLDSPAWNVNEIGQNIMWNVKR